MEQSPQQEQDEDVEQSEDSEENTSEPGAPVFDKALIPSRATPHFINARVVIGDLPREKEKSQVKMTVGFGCTETHLVDKTSKDAVPHLTHPVGSYVCVIYEYTLSLLIFGCRREHKDIVK